MNVRKVTLLMTATIALAAVASASATTGHSIHRRTVGFAIGTRYFGSHARLEQQRGLAAAFDLRGGLGFGSALVGSAPAGKFPAAVAFDTATHTIYVADGFGYSGPLAPGDTVSVIDARHCNARDVSSCPGPWPTMTVGSGTAGDDPSGIAVDVLTDTVYASNFGAGTVSVINGATCNAMVRSGCGQIPVSVPVGDNPVGLFADPDNRTVYVPNVGDTAVSMIDSASCNATDPAGRPSTPPPTVDVGANPTSAEADLATHTLYV